MRLCLFTDTLNDVNGVSRFIRNVGDQAAAAGGGHELHIITSTRLPEPPGGSRPFIHNVPPLYARAMPGYANLELAIPLRRRLRALTRELKPDAVHISTPGPVGFHGRAIARRMGGGVPILGTYHTDFPAYIQHLFNEPAFTWVCTKYMAWFYRRFTRIFTRSDEYGRAIQRLGVPADRIVRLLPGIDTRAFDARARDPSGEIWRNCPGVRPESVKALYVGRVSVEKNLPLLTRIWPRIAEACRARGVDAQLLVVGDGPYRAQMESELSGKDAVFLGFRHGRELSTIYASSDLFIFPSTTDTLGQVVMEAQCAGLPVIVTDQGGPSEVVDEGATGFVLPAEAEPRWVETISALIADGPRRRRMGAAGTAKIAPMSIANSFAHFWKVHEEASAECGVRNAE